MLRLIILLLLICRPAFSLAQTESITGRYFNMLDRIQVDFYEDSSFDYSSKMWNPVFHRYEPLSESGFWSMAGDTIILNPHLEKKRFVDFSFSESKFEGDSTVVVLSFNHIRRHYDIAGNLTANDTIQFYQLDFAFNELKKKKLKRVSSHQSIRCAFAGYIPKEILTDERSIVVPKPSEKLKSIFIGCYELQGTKEFLITDNSSNQFTLNVYSNYYSDGQIRQMRLLKKNKRVIYYRIKENGEFVQDRFWSDTDAKLIKQKTNR